MMLMHFVRKALLVVVSPIFVILLFATALDMGVIRIVGQPAGIKKILAGSDIYKGAINGLLDQAKQVTSDNGSGSDSVSLNNPIIRSAANSTFSPQFLRSNTETVIDSTYRWLNGLTPVPDFKIDLTNSKNQFAAAVSKAVAQKAVLLPTCTSANMPATFDALSATCLPPGVTPAAAASEVEGTILDGKGFLDHPVINADSITLPKYACVDLPDASPCPPAQKVSVFKNQLKDAPKQYQRVKKTPLILSITTLFVAVTIVFLSSSRRKGIRHVGTTLLVIGLLLLVFAFVLNSLVSKKLTPRIKLNNTVLQADVRRLVTDVGQKIDQNYWIFGGVYTVLGGLVLGAGMFWPGNKTRASNSKASASAHPKSEDESPPTKPKAEAEPAKPVKRTIKIQ